MAKKEAERILESLPVYTPGFQNGNPVNVMVDYGISLEKKPEVATLESVDIPPIPEKCKKEDKKKECLLKWISRYVNSNFNPDLVKSNKKGVTTYKSIVNFIIDLSSM